MTADKHFKRLVRRRASRTGESYAVARHWILRKQSEEPTMTSELIPVTIAAIKLNVGGERDGTPVVDLAEVDGPRHVYIMIGRAEAEAMRLAMQAAESRRPRTHDLLNQAVDALGGRVARIVIRHPPDEDFYAAEVVLDADPQRAEVSLDARPSDALALAVRRDPVPLILAEASLLEPEFVPKRTN